MKNMMYFLLCCIATVPLFSQEPLWRRGGSFRNTEIYERKIHNNHHSSGLYYNGKDIYFLRSDTDIELYNPQTLVKSIKRITNVGRIIQVSPHCALVLIEHPDSVILFDVRQSKSLYSLKGKHSVLSFSRDSRYTVFSNGDIIDWNDTVISSPIKQARKANTVDQYAEWSSDGKILMWGQKDSLYVFDAVNNSDTWIRFSYENDSRFRFSTTGKTILNFTDNQITCIRTNDGRMYSRSLNSSDSYNDDYEFLDDEYYVRGTRKDNGFVLSKKTYNDTTAQEERLLPDIRGGILYEFMAADTSVTKGKMMIASFEGNDCGGMPMLTNIAFHFADIRQSQVQVIPDKTMDCVNSTCFMDGDSMLVSLTCKGVLVQTHVQNGSIKNIWQLPKSIFEDSAFFVRGYGIYSQVLSSQEYVIFNAGKKIYRFSTKQGVITDSMSIGDTSLTSITYSSDKQYILAMSGDKVVIINNKDFTYIKTITAESRLFHVSMHNDSVFCSIAGEGRIVIYSFSQGTRLGTILAEENNIHLSISGTSYAVGFKYPTIFLRTMSSPLKLDKNRIYPSGSVSIYFSRIMNHDNLWSIVIIPFSFLGDKQQYVNLVKIVNDSLLLVKSFSNSFTCQTENIVVSNNGKYVLARGIFGFVFDMYAVDNIFTSVDEDIITQDAAPHAGLMVNATGFSLRQPDIFESCTVFSSMGEYCGTANIVSGTEQTFIELPQNLANGMYILHLQSTTSTKIQYIVLVK